MKKQFYDKVGTVSVLLNKKLKYLSDFQKEKDAILKMIDDLTKQELLEQNRLLVHNKMTKNLEGFKRIVAEIEELNKYL